MKLYHDGVVGVLRVPPVVTWNILASPQLCWADCSRVLSYLIVCQVMKVPQGDLTLNEVVEECVGYSGFIGLIRFLFLYRLWFFYSLWCFIFCVFKNAVAIIFVVCWCDYFCVWFFSVVFSYLCLWLITCCCDYFCVFVFWICGGILFLYFFHLLLCLAICFCASHFSATLVWRKEAEKSREMRY